MSLIVQKFGGTSVATSEHIKRVAARVVATHRAGNQVVVVVSAMGLMTDELAELAGRISPNPPAREMDMLLTAGERISMALLAMALHAEGVEAMSLTGSQAGILTMGAHGSAEIHEVRSFRVQDGLDDGKVVIVAGFQGVDPESKDVTTLGRGGSDVTAVALAVRHGAAFAEIYKDVDGVFTADPRWVPDAILLGEVSYTEMAALAAGGSQVLMGRAVDIARSAGLPIHIRSSFHEDEGTWVRAGASERRLVCGVAHDQDVARITLRRLAAGRSTEVLKALTEAGLPSDVVVMSPAGAGVEDLTFASAESSAQLTTEVISDITPKALVEIRPGLGKVSLVGEAITAATDYESDTLRTLASSGISAVASAVVAGRVSCVVERSDLAEAVRAVHERMVVAA